MEKHWGFLENVHAPAQEKKKCRQPVSCLSPMCDREAVALMAIILASLALSHYRRVILNKKWLYQLGAECWWFVFSLWNELNLFHERAWWSSGVDTNATDSSPERYVLRPMLMQPLSSSWRRLHGGRTIHSIIQSFIHFQYPILPELTVTGVCWSLSQLTRYGELGLSYSL